MKIPEDIPAVVLIADKTGHATMHLLPGEQGAALRNLLDVPAWDSEGESVEELLAAMREVLVRRREFKDTGSSALRKRFAERIIGPSGTTFHVRNFADGTD